VAELDMPYVYHVNNGLLSKMSVNQSMMHVVADVTSAAATITRQCFACKSSVCLSTDGVGLF